MYGRDQELSDRAVSAFLLRFAADRDSGVVRPLSEYLSDYPTHEREVAQEYLTLTDAGLAIDDAEVPVDPQAEPGDRFGPFQVERELGRGGQATVYAALDTRIGRQVALKVLHSTLGAAAQAITERFRREAELLARLDHPAICVVHEAAFDTEPPYIAMRFVAGESLGQKIANARAEIDASTSDAEPRGAQVSLLAMVDGLPISERLPRLLEYFESSARALHLAHEASLVHRDIKPANLMVTPAGDPVILDFGLAQEEQRGTACLTLTGQVLGTPAYMAPELLREDSPIDGAERASDRRVDVYALGVALYECIALERPFHAPTIGGLYHKILRGEYEPLRKCGSKLPVDLEVVMAVALETDPARRYQTAEDFADDLLRLRRREPVRARRASLRVRAVRWVQRYPLLAALLAVVVSTLTVGLLVALSLLGEKDAALNKLDRLLGLSDAQALAQLEASREGLVFVPGQEPTERWLDAADELLRKVPDHAAELERLRATALPYSESAQERDRRDNAAQNRDLPARIERLRQRLGNADGAERDALEAQILELGVELDRRRTWEFAATSDSWRNAALVELIEQLAELRTTANAVRDEWETVAEIERRLAGEDAQAWRDAAALLTRDSRFAGFELAPQYGLVPIGVDPRSGLLEFVHAISGDVPRRDPQTGALEFDDQSGIVFVLVPGGTFAMGASPDRDSSASDGESPVHEVKLEPFFLAKHEVTQSQWLRLYGRNDSRYAAGESHYGKQVTLRHPAEWIPWKQADFVARRYGLLLPTEAQWEYGARAGSSDPWWTGPDRESLRGAGNVLDRSGGAAGLRKGVAAANWIDDGYVYHAPVGSYRANAFGLHDTIGNVAEWCRDRYVSYVEPVREGDGLRADGAGDHVLRGGSFYHSIDRVRASSRTKLGVFYGLNIGVRFARGVQPALK